MIDQNTFNELCDEHSRELFAIANAAKADIDAYPGVKEKINIKRCAIDAMIDKLKEQRRVWDYQAGDDHKPQIQHAEVKLEGWLGGST